MKMSGRLKSFMTVLILILLAALLTGPPVSFAIKLPTSCNIFHDKKEAKSGPCGHQATFTQEKSHFGEVVVFNGQDSGILGHKDVLTHNLLSFSSQSFIILESLPLRC
jgi:hypothetical protein